MKRLLLVAAVMLLFGCLQPAVKLGCCMKINATMNETDPTKNTCVLYNITDFQTTDAFAASCGGSSNTQCTHGCNDTAGGCNVSVKVGSTYKNFMIPVCTLDDIQPCISGNCTAMVCGDFEFKPRVAPTLTATKTTDSEGKNTSASLNTGGGTPAGTSDKGGAMQFYNSQCRFLPMDAKLSRIMKNSKSQINVFRMGVGGSFDEFDQYRYFFPMSDKYCNLNSRGSIDRYMNYLTSDYSAYDAPVTAITSNCMNDSGVLPPFGFNESFTTRTSKFPTTAVFTYSTKIPDFSNYKRAYFARADYSGNAWFESSSVTGSYEHFYNATSGQYDSIYVPGPTAYSYNYGTEKVDTPNGIYKKVDNGFYRKYLSIAHADQMYGITGCGSSAATASSTRAPFECDVAANDCYSGSCNTQTYTRSVMLRNAADPLSAPEVVTDCNKMADENGQTKVICAPTTSVSVSCSAGVPPTYTYARVKAVAGRTDTYDSDVNAPFGNGIYGMGDLSEDNALDIFWGNLTVSHSINDMVGNPYPINGWSEYTITNYARTTFNEVTKKNCPDKYPGSEDDSNKTMCPLYMDESPLGPPVAGAVFFGKTGDTDVPLPSISGVSDGEKVVIGYSIASPDDFANMLVVKNCGMVEGTDYVKVRVDGMQGANWSALMTAFTPYFETRVKSLKSSMGDGCGSIVHWGSPNKLQAYDTVLSSVPWVVGYTKWMRRVYYEHGHSGDHDPEGYEKFSEYLVSESAQALRTKNIYDTAMLDTRGTSSCELRATTSHEAYDADKKKHIRYVYDIVFSRYVYLFKYAPNTFRIGNCAVDENTRLPVTKTFGWCEPCTTSTLAYQNVTAVQESYIPGHTGKVEANPATDVQTICTPKRVHEPINESNDWNARRWAVNASCFNKYISDVQDYNGRSFETGAPRTVPEATIMKERMGDYMKSGVMPVLDLSDASNWNISNNYTYGAQNYSEYDFKRLFGSMGATVVIVEHLRNRGDATFEKVDEMIERGATVKDYCFGCLTAFHVDTPLTAASFNSTVREVFLDPRAAYAIDMVTFDYPVSVHTGIATPGMLADDLAAYGEAALRAGNTPTMVVGLNVRCEDIRWTNNTLSDCAAAKNTSIYGVSATVGEDNTTATIAWRTNVSGTSILNYGANTSLGSAATGTDGTAHSITLTGLNSDTPYYYTVTSCQGIGNCTTAGQFAFTTNSSMVPGNYSYDDLFGAIVTKQDKLIKAGITGVIYSPARMLGEKSLPDPNGSWLARAIYNYYKDTAGTGLVDVNLSSGVGFKSAKFCGMQDAMYKMSTTAPTAVFSKTMSMGELNCTPCSSTDKILKNCGPPDGGTVPVCDNGQACGLGGLTASEAKCPDNSVTPDCALCNESTRQYNCTKTYANGTVTHLYGNLADVTSDLYMDILAGIPKPDKCCIRDQASGINYTYYKTAYGSPLNKPLVFPKSGANDTDCGFGASVGDMNKLTSFCSIQQTQIKDYDVTCRIVGRQ